MLERARFLTELLKLLWATAGGSLAVALTADRVTLPGVGQEVLMWTGLAFAATLAIMAGTLVVVTWRIIRDETARPH